MDKSRSEKGEREYSCDLYFAGVSDLLQQRWSKNKGSNSWKSEVKTLNRVDQLFTHCYDRCVYLSPDAADVLDFEKEINSSSLFILGGIVDLNATSKLSLRRAKELQDRHSISISTARLPIQELLPLCTDRVLNINHCFEILLLLNLPKFYPRRF